MNTFSALNSNITSNIFIIINDGDYVIPTDMILPNQISNMYLWLDANDNSTFTFTDSTFITAENVFIIYIIYYNKIHGSVGIFGRTGDHFLNFGCFSINAEAEKACPHVGPHLPRNEPRFAIEEETTFPSVHPHG